MQSVSAKVTDVKMSAKVEPLPVSDNQGFTNFMFARSTLMFAFGGIYTGDIFKRYRKIRRTAVGVSMSVLSAVTTLFCLNFYYKTTTPANLLLQSSGYLQIFINAIVCSLTISKDIKHLKKHLYDYEKRHCLCANVPKMKKWITFSCIPLFAAIPAKAVVEGLNLLPARIYSSWLFESPWIYIGKCVTTFSFIISCAQGYGFLTLTTPLVYILWREFIQIDEKFKQLIKSDDPSVEETTDAIMCQHETLAKILSLASTCFQFFSFNMIFITIIANGVYFYIAVSQSVSITENIFIWFMMTSTMLTVAVILLMQAQLCSKAHAPLQHLWMLNKNHFSDRGLQKLNLWVSRLTGEPIAFSIYGLITINLPTLMGMFGTVVTYIFVVLQFGSSGGSTCQTPHGNMSLNI
ncbi:uncharacterized protein LOC124135034 [Haliotis rufescens]|uniref:uncharacterized protein LOC124135034 n=1 Tax=Haliotis rufescens TaxID=6454 RepID=UPI00201F118F|nr:uncharacterized protein LOC124135034 [Haliotis rufescens]